MMKALLDVYSCIIHSDAFFSFSQSPFILKLEYEKTSIEFINALRTSLLAEADGEDETSIRY